MTAATNVMVKRHTPQMMRRARQVATQVLFQDLFHGGDHWAWRQFIAQRLRHFPRVIRFCRTLVVGVRQHRQQLDAALQAAIPHWNLARLAKVDFTILLIGAFELLYSATPPKAVIDEAIELARLFGGKDSSSFVNGVLDRVWRNTLDGSSRSNIETSKE